MAAVVQIFTKRGVAGDEAQVTGVDLTTGDTLPYGEPSLYNRTTYPIEVPDSGSNYSMETYVGFELTTAPDVQVYDLWVWAPTSPPKDGAPVYACVRTAYDTPVIPTSVAASGGSGTVSVTNGSKTVTGSGTSFDSDFDNGEFIVINGRPYQVESVTSATELTLVLEYDGSTASGVSYQIAPYARLDTDFDGSDAYHKLYVPGSMSTVGDKIGYLVLVQEAQDSALPGRVPPTEDTWTLMWSYDEQ